MTSPMSNLGKTKRSPLTRPPPFRPVVDIDAIINSDLERNSFMSDDIPADCEQLVDEVTTSTLQKNKPSSMKSPWMSNASPMGKQGQGPNDMELMSSMMGRISQLQLRIQFMEKELAEKDSQMKMLQHKLKHVQNTQATSIGGEQKVRALDNENKKLRKQVYDMEEFLADYGMMWLGNSDSESDDDSEGASPIKMTKSKVWQPSQSVPQFQVDYDMILENIKDLNVLAGEGETRIHHRAGGAELKRPDPVNLSLYENGILMFNGPFRPFSDPVTQHCVQDLMDGYFPTELQSRYPDGILFSVHDKRNMTYEQKSLKAFEGQGQTLGGDTKPSRLVPSNLEKMSSSRTTNSSHIRPLSREQFLSKLPSNVVKKGKVLDIRQAVSDLIQGDEKLPGSVSVVNTEVVDNLRKSAKGIRAPTPDLEAHCSTLRIKHTDVTFVLVMKYNETVGDIRKHLCEHSRALVKLNFDLVTSYPRKIYSDDSMTLEQAGLTPNAMLHLQVRK